MTAAASALGRADERFLVAAPAARLGLLRILIGGYALGYLLVRLPHLLALARFDDARFDPLGPLAWLPGPVTPGVGQVVLVVALATGSAFVAGWRWRLTGPAFALAFLAVTTYRSSWGQIFHTDNLPALHLLLLAVSPAADAWSLDARRRGGPRAATAAYGWPVRLITIVTVAAYVVAGWAKLRNSGLAWVTGDVLRNHIAHDALRKSLVGGSWSSLGTSLLPHAWLFPPLALVSLLVELGAPLALVDRRLRVGWVAAAWLFHVGVVALMLIGFPYQLSGVAYASFFPLERVPARLREARRGRRGG